jgi:ribose transport system substrate-binding protein
MRLHARVIAGVAVVALALAGCTSGHEGVTPAVGTAGGYRITFVEGLAGDPFYAAMACGVRAEAAKLGASASVTGAGAWDARAQTSVVNSVTATRPDAVLIAPDDGTEMIPPLRAMTDAGVKLVLVDTGLADDSLAQSLVTSDNEAGGKLAADTLATLIGGKGSVFVQDLAPGVSSTDARARGFADEIKAKYPDITVLDTTFDAGEPATAAQLTASVLAAHPDLAGVFATEVQGTEGVADAVKAAKKQGVVKIVGFDAGAQEVQDLHAGVVQALVAQQPYQIGVDGVDEAIASLSGRSVTNSVRTGVFVLTGDNVGSVEQHGYPATCPS